MRLKDRRAGSYQATSGEAFRWPVGADSCRSSILIQFSSELFDESAAWRTSSRAELTRASVLDFCALPASPV